VESSRFGSFWSPGVVTAGNSGWSVYGAQQAQPLAIIGKSPDVQNRKDKRNPLPRVATICMVSSHGGAVAATVAG
jgi:hypothetical protein